MTSLTEAELIEAATTYFRLNAEMLAPYLVFASIATYLAIGYALRGMFYIEQLRAVLFMSHTRRRGNA